MNLSLNKRSTKNIHKAEAGDSLGSILEKSQSSHDPIFIYENGTLVGITSPYYAVFKKRYPYSTKAINASFMPPRLKKNTTAYEVADHMLSTKVYTLPIFENDKLSGVVTAKDILKTISDNSILNEMSIEIKKPITIKNDKKVKDAFTKMIKESISRLIIVDAKGHLEGVLSRRDLQEAFSTPSRKQRYGKSKTSRTWSFDDEKIKRGDYPLHEFYRTDVAKIDEDTPLTKALKEMMRRNVGSIIFVNADNKPTGIITTHSFLKALSGLAPTQAVKVLLSDKHDSLSKIDKQQIEKELVRLYKKIEKRKNHIFQIEASVDEDKNNSGRIRSFQLLLNISLDKKRDIYTKVNGKNLKKTLNKAVKKIENQLQ